MIGGKGISSGSMNAHKAMAGAGKDPDFGCCAYPTGKQIMDASSPNGSMGDGDRSGPVSGKDMMKQGAPQHGDIESDGWERGGKV